MASGSVKLSNSSPARRYVDQDVDAAADDEDNDVKHDDRMFDGGIC